MSSSLAAALLAELDDQALDVLAERLAPLLADRLAQRDGLPAWLDTKAAALYLSCSPGRIHDLVGLRKLEPRRDGRSLRFRRSDLDAYLEASA
jgi:excisionase family DNA binding protein